MQALREPLYETILALDSAPHPDGSHHVLFADGNLESVDRACLGTHKTAPDASGEE